METGDLGRDAVQVGHALAADERLVRGGELEGGIVAQGVGIFLHQLGGGRRDQADVDDHHRGAGREHRDGILAVEHQLGHLRGAGVAVGQLAEPGVGGVHGVALVGGQRLPAAVDQSVGAAGGGPGGQFRRRGHGAATEVEGERPVGVVLDGALDGALADAELQCVLCRDAEEGHA